MPGLCFSTADVLRRISEVKLSTGVTLVRLDIKDFFMDGDHGTLVRGVVNLFSPGPLREWVQDTLWFLLVSQLVRADGQVSRVTCGSGMGTVHSSSVADAVFFALGEADLDLSALGVEMYLRYRDDIFAVCVDRAAADRLCETLSKKVSSCWRVVVDSVSGYGVPFLDLFLYKGPRYRATGYLDYGPYNKPTKVGVPLSDESAHPRHIHHSWPQGEFRRIQRNSFHHTFRSREVDRHTD